LPRLPAAVEVGAYRIVQESLANVVRHAGATTVRVGLRLEHECLEVCVADNGTGELRPRPAGVGLGSMRARAEEIGGQFELVGIPGLGTTVRARLPLTTGTPS
jgi:signal transduction histidine kinase